MISTGFPAPGDDQMAESLNLNQLLIMHPAATFFLKVSGNSMVEDGIREGDILIVDRSLNPAVKKIVIASVNGELIVKRLTTEDEGKISEELDFCVWGVVTTVIHSV